ncbi:NAD(P)-binding domain-containing protein [Streptomyces sp. DSM 44917]|uniref:NAD(P)-binding domain-containing protein n=1 Tax=Streptomyces boetiae TaxID=3075541 RepID=A0ABU2LDS5_9ACTN|nr:NAD(P)-binding domain-containing protein [Streptomyces sp. DSM 44917]MDT0309737.1 NAD(P)-binding domain-containing protein [Streptomyces sp. DSM 44917]
MRVTIVGTGAMAHGIATIALAGGHAVRLLGRTPGHAARLAGELAQVAPDGEVTASDVIAVEDADLVVLAVPWPATREVVAGLGTALAGTVLVDLCNPVASPAFDALAVPPGTSAAELLAAEAPPGAPVVKAFNTVFAPVLLSGRVDGRPVDVFVAGDDEDGRRAVAALAAGGGLRPLDVGPLRRARELEAFQLLHMAAQERLGLNWSSAVTILP